MGMDLLIISNLFPPHVLGGYEILCGQVCERLRGRGHSVTVLTSGHGVAAGEREEDPLVHRTLSLYQPFSLPAGMMRFKRRKTALLNARVTRRLLAGRRFHAAFVWSQLRLTPGAARAAQSAGLPTAFTFNDAHPLSYIPSPRRSTPVGVLRWAADRTVFRPATWLGLDARESTCISRTLLEELRAGGMPLPTCRVIYQGIPVERFPLKDSPGEMGTPMNVLYAGQLHAYKGVHTLLDGMAVAAEKLPGIPLQLTIAGHGDAPYTDRLKERAAACPFPVRFAGRVPHDQVPALYREHHLFVFPSVWKEPFGLTHLEAMASGTPVVSTADGGHGEFLLHGENALVFRPEDAEELASHIVRMRVEDGLAPRLARRARAMVEGDFSIDRYVADLESLLSEAVGVRP